MKFPVILSVLCTVGTLGIAPVTSADTGSSVSLNFDASRYVARQITVNGATLAVRAYENLVYVANPVDVAVQSMNIYVPETYFHNGRIGKHDAQNAPIFLPNYVGGYMPSKPGTLDGMGMPGPANQPNMITLALSKGYVVATPGARGRTSQTPAGQYTGKAPAAIVDLKAAVRYLRFNDVRMPGDAEKIISNGTSAGGALSALLGASGNSADYEAELRTVGAAPGRDDIFAVSAYCPIANLEHADAAYEWQFNAIHDYKSIEMSMLDFKMQRKEVAGTLTVAQIQLSKELRTLFPAYVNSLKLQGPNGQALTLDATGNGSFKDYIRAQVIASAQQALNKGQNLSAFDWLQIEGKTVRGLDFDRYLVYLERQKQPPAFDGVNLGNGENQLFGSQSIDKSHFTDLAAAHSTVAGAPRADARVVGMMNPMNYIGAAGTQNAKYWRIRHGTKDRDTSLAVPALLALTLGKHGIPTDFALHWDRPHSGDYDPDELFAWMEQVSGSVQAGKH